MVRDAQKIDQNTELSCDICIVGAGASGITVANELSTSHLKVILLESGGMGKESATQNLYRGEVVNPDQHGALHLYRERSFGGTTNVWGGRCAPFDPIDFESRPYIPDSGWPVKRQDLDEYYQRAHRYCEAGEYEYSASKALPSCQPAIEGFHSDDLLTDSIWRFSPPTNFRKLFYHTLSVSKNIDILLHANCLKIIPNESGTAIDKVLVSSLGRNPFFIKAKKFVLAAGGLEVARLLLLSNDVHAKGIGNQEDLVGRYYGSHITGTYGKFVFSRGKRVQWDFDRTADGVYCRRKFTISGRKQKEFSILNMSGMIDHPLASDAAHGNGVLSSMYLLKRLLSSRIPPEYSRSLSTLGKYRDVISHVRNILLDAPGLAKFSVKWVDRRILRYRKLPSVTLPSKINEYSFHFDSEQSPNSQSRVTLSRSGRDFFNLPQLRVDWRINSGDIQMVERTYQFIDEELRRSGAGMLQFDKDSISEVLRTTLSVGSHHLGTTRMADSPKRGVVNAHCAVFSIPNLYIASPSIFATTGYANPLLTTVAFSIRLSDHLKRN